MWPEPLTAGSIDRNEHLCDIIVRQGDGSPVAAVLCGCNRQTHTGFFGVMEITAPGGSPRQRIRALVLLPFAERMSNTRGRELHAGGRFDLAGDLATIRTHALDTTDADGNPKAISPSPNVGAGPRARPARG
ncbi:MAG: hypothetical protein ACYDEB_03850 [Dehalococcoidia bacterium]